MLYEVITTFVTTSSLTGVQQAPVNDPTDTVSITGVDGVEGNWTTDAVLNLPVGGPLPATCTLSPLVTSGPFAADVTCALDAPAELTDPGVYCWDVTVSQAILAIGRIRRARSGVQQHVGAAHVVRVGAAVRRDVQHLRLGLV